jgi:hypothetical protein
MALGYVRIAASPVLTGEARLRQLAKNRFRCAACVGVACLSTALLGGALLVLAFEGVICIIMAAPLALLWPLSEAVVLTRFSAAAGREMMVQYFFLFSFSLSPAFSGLSTR